MITKIISLVKGLFFRRNAPPESEDIRNEMLEKPCMEFVLQINEAGDFSVGAEIVLTSQESSYVTGTALQLLNTGHLAEYFIESLQLASVGDTKKIQFKQQTLSQWKQMFQQEYEEGQYPSSKPAVDPQDVFNPYRNQS